jgi:NaMN:DMB phosphoribosyltransferase
MDILAGVFAYAAGIGALFAGLAFSFFVFFAAPPTASVAPPSATAMVVKPMASNRSSPAATSPQATHHEKHSPAVAAGPGAARPGTKDFHRKPAMAATHLRVQEERARRWADQQNSRFDNRVLGYAE